MSVKVREKVKGSKVWWLIISHKGQRASKRIGMVRVSVQGEHSDRSNVNARIGAR